MLTSQPIVMNPGDAYRGVRSIRSRPARQFIEIVKRQYPGTLYFRSVSSKSLPTGYKFDERIFAYVLSREDLDKFAIGLKEIGVNVAFQFQQPSSPDAKRAASLIPGGVYDQILGVPAHLKRAEEALAKYDAETEAEARRRDNTAKAQDLVTAVPAPRPFTPPWILIAGVGVLVTVLAVKKYRS